MCQLVFQGAEAEPWVMPTESLSLWSLHERRGDSEKEFAEVYRIMPGSDEDTI